MTTTDADMEARLRDLLESLIYATEGGDYPPDLPEEFRELAGVSTFADAGVMTHNRGLVVRMADDSEFQITIVQSR